MEGFSPSNIWPKDYRGYMSSAPRKNQIYHQKILRHATIYILCWRHGSKRLNQLIYIVCFCLDIWLQMYWWSITLVMDRSLFSCLKLHFCFVIHLKKKTPWSKKRRRNLQTCFTKCIIFRVDEWEETKQTLWHCYMKFKGNFFAARGESYQTPFKNCMILWVVEFAGTLYTLWNTVNDKFLTIRAVL